MARLERLKEELNWLRVVFAIFIASDLSLIGYFAQNYNTQNKILNIISVISIIIFTLVIILINKIAYKKLDEMEEL